MRRKCLFILLSILVLIIILLFGISRSPHEYNILPTPEQTEILPSNTSSPSALPIKSRVTEVSSPQPVSSILSEQATAKPTSSSTPKPITGFKDFPFSVLTSSSPSSKPTTKPTATPSVQTTQKPVVTPTEVPTTTPTSTTEKIWIVDIPGHYETVSETTEIWIDETGHWEDSGYWTSDWVYQCNSCSVTYSSSGTVNDHIWAQFDKDSATPCASYTQVSGELYWVEADPIWIVDMPGHYETQTTEKQIWVEEQGHWEIVQTE